MKIEELLSSIEETVGEATGDSSGIRKGIETIAKEILQRSVTSIVNDHNLVTPESVFVAISGSQVDSHNFT